MRTFNLFDASYLMRYLQLPHWQQWLIAITLACLPFFTLFYVAISPAKEQQTFLQQERDLLTNQLHQLTQHYHSFPTTDELTNNITLLQQQSSIQLPSNEQQNGFTKVITHYLSQSNSQLVLLKRLTPEQNAFFSTQKWQLKLNGSYIQLFQFMTLLTESGRLLTIEQFMLEKDNEQLNLELIIHLYYAAQYHYA